jgi:hypothetical protein
MSRPELAELDAAECYRLLATHEIGRLGVNAEHYPVIFPVNYALDREVIVIRTHPGTKLTAAGRANVTDAHRAELVERTRASGVRPWAPGEHGRWVRIIPQGISGRRIVPGELPPPFGPGGYL